MKIIESHAGALTDFEVLSHLRSRGVGKDHTRIMRSGVSPSEFKVQFVEMSWNQSMEVHYPNQIMPYNSIGSFVDFFGGLTYDHVNYIFADANYVQENAYPSTNTSLRCLDLKLLML